MTSFIEVLQLRRDRGDVEFVANDTDVSLPSSFDSYDIKKVARRFSTIMIKDASNYISRKESLQNDLQSYTRRIREMKQEVDKLEDQIAKMANVEKILPDIEKQLEKIFERLPVIHVELKETATTVFTTQLMKKDQEVRGIYRIYIDWLRPEWRSGVRINNIYKKAGTAFDHPCVNDRIICPGNGAATFEKYFKEHNIFELLSAIIEFLMSDTVQAGYISSWSQWLRQARKVNTQRTLESFNANPTIDPRLVELEKIKTVPEARSIDEADQIPF